GKTVLMRADFNIPLNENQKITDDFRIKSALPSINKIINEGGKLVLCSHLGRPKGEKKPELSLKPVAERLSELLGKNVNFVKDSIGEEVQSAKAKMKDGDVILLENLRYYKEEMKNNPDFAKKLMEDCDVFVNDAFGTAHRAHASTAGVNEYFEKNLAGYLIQKEIDFLSKATVNPEKPFYAILGGAKISGKIDVIQNLMGKVDGLFIGGAMIFTFFKAMGYEIGKSLLEEDKVGLAKEILESAKAKGISIILPEDVLVADKFETGAETKIVCVKEIPAHMVGVDVGPATLKKFKEILADAKTVVWNGPLGAFEIPEFSKGTFGLAEYLAEITKKGAVTIVGGGDSAAAVNVLGLN
ncbi:MAG: phosphoglycerate kinase, partial [Calditrichia bacterium]|nr:phosphoglycerate kinase [Calditrichia bacterium]